MLTLYSGGFFFNKFSIDLSLQQGESFFSGIQVEKSNREKIA